MQMGGFQKWYANLDRNGPQKFIFPINLAIFLCCIGIHNICHFAGRNFIKTLAHFGSVEIIQAYLGSF